MRVCGPAPTLRCLRQSQAGGSSRPGARGEHCPCWGGSIAPSRTEVAWAPALLGKVSTGIRAGAGRRRKRTCRACERSSGSWGEVLFSLPHVSFVFRSPTEEASSERQRWGQSPPAQRQLPTGSVTAVTLFRSNQRRQRMTWGWCSPAPGLIGPSSGLNAKVSWQREAEEPDFAVPAGLRERQASQARSSAQGPRPSPGTVSAERACPSQPGHPEGSARCGDTCPPAGTRWGSETPAQTRRRSWLRLGVGMGKSLVSGKVTLRWGLGEGCLGRSCTGRGSRGALQQLCGQLSCPKRMEQVILASFGFA